MIDTRLASNEFLQGHGIGFQELTHSPQERIAAVAELKLHLIEIRREMFGREPMIRAEKVGMDGGAAVLWRPNVCLPDTVDPRGPKGK